MKWMSLIIICCILLTACGTKGNERDVHTFSEAINQVQTQKAATTTAPSIQATSIEVQSVLKKEEPVHEQSKSVILAPAINKTPPTIDSTQKQPATATVVEQPKEKATPNMEPAVEMASKENVTKTKNSELKWSEFFDTDKQTTPSNKFWDLSGKQVEIKGYMGEVLSMEKSWFLLIPEPGAECPFDNGDETYWNKIMIVYLPKGEKLRFTPGPLQITGRLDVGIKIDESGYKTMFRLYDAKFDKIKE